MQEIKIVGTDTVIEVRDEDVSSYLGSGSWELVGEGKHAAPESPAVESMQAAPQNAPQPSEQQNSVPQTPQGEPQTNKD